VGLHTRWGPARVDGLHNRRFSEPVTVHRVHADGTVHPTLIITTKDAYDALIEVGHAWRIRLGKLPSTRSCGRCSTQLPRTSKRAVLLSIGYTTRAILEALSRAARNRVLHSLIRHGSSGMPLTAAMRHSRGQRRI
jgi:hypothetical protein